MVKKRSRGHPRRESRVFKNHFSEENSANLGIIENQLSDVETSITDIETEIGILQEADVTINGNIENLGTQEELSKEP